MVKVILLNEGKACPGSCNSSCGLAEDASEKQVSHVSEEHMEGDPSWVSHATIVHTMTLGAVQSHRVLETLSLLL